MIAQVSKPKGMKKKSRGSSRARAGYDAKAGKRRKPAVLGPHTTTEHDRARGRWLASLGLKFFRRPAHLRDDDKRITS